jgi:monoamine oxidase
MKKTECDVGIIGAGVAGLAAARVLARAGKRVRCLEARDRVGGRILTVHDPLSPLAIELGAEFVHGRPTEVFDLIRDEGLLTFEHNTLAVHFDHGPVLNENRVGGIADRVLSKMAKSRRQKDESFEDYLRHSRQPARVASWARVHIEGFNAARRELISAASLAEDAGAAEKIEGERIFKIPSGYDAVPLALLHAIPVYQSVLELNSIVSCVKWRRGVVEVQYKSALNHQESVLKCKKLIVTVPLGVLQAPTASTGAIRFEPEPRAVMKAAGTLRPGHVYRVVFRFQDAFWEETKSLRQAGFLISKETPFMSWWTTHPVMSPVLTGWSAGTLADQFLGLDQQQIANEALRSLAQILRRKIPRPAAVYFHDWQADPFARGAYSYVPVGASRRALSRPVDDTLFFAGEAANRNGQGATVHGAIESGIGAASLALR